MARELRTVPESQAFIDREVLPGWVVTWSMGRTATGRWGVHTLQIAPAYGSHWRSISMRQVPGAGITARLLRGLSMPGITNYARRVIWQDTLNPDERQPRKRSNALPGRPLLRSVQDYKKFAARYLKLKADGCKAVSRTLAKEYKLPVSTINSMIYRCRHDRALLPML